MKKFQKDTEDAMNKNIEALKHQMRENEKAKDALETENKHQKDIMRKMASRIADLESKVQKTIINILLGGSKCGVLY